MGLPSDVIVELGVTDVQDEWTDLVGGWSDITDYVLSLSGQLRGRSYEIGSAESGSLTLKLLNEDGRFTPERPSSPYYPHIVPERPIRVRGKNMAIDNVATTGAKERNAKGFFISEYAPSAGATSLSDSFGRTASSGWGNADTSQAWSRSGGDAADFSVSGGLGRVTQPTTNVRRFTYTDAYTDATITAQVVAPDNFVTGSHITAGIVTRFVDVNNFYLFNITFQTDNRVLLSLGKMVGGAFTTLPFSADIGIITFGVRVNVTIEQSGTSLKCKAWKDTEPEPGVWHIVTTDSSLTSAGAVGTHSLRLTGNTNSTFVARFDNFSVVSGTSTLFAPKRVDVPSPVDTSRSITFEEGTNAAAVQVTGDVIEVSGATYTNQAIRGSFAMLNDNVTYARVTNAFGAGTHSGSIYARIPAAVASGAARLVTFTSASNINLAAIRVNNMGELQIANGSNAAQVTGAVTTEIGQAFRLDWQWDASVLGTLAAPVLKVRVYLNPDSTVHDEELSWTASGLASAAARWALGALSGTAGWSSHLDDHRYTTALTWMGPSTAINAQVPSVIAGVYPAQQVDERWLMNWHASAEAGQRITYSAYIRQANTNTVPTEAQIFFGVNWFDVAGNKVNGSLYTEVNKSSQTWIRYAVSGVPPEGAVWALGTLSMTCPVDQDGGGGPVADLTYWMSGYQEEKPANVHPNPNGNGDYSWSAQNGVVSVLGDGVKVTWDGGTDIYTALCTDVSGLIPGQSYGVTAEVTFPVGAPEVRMSVNDGETGPTASTGTAVPMSLVFVPETSTVRLSWTATPATVAEGANITVKNVQIVRGDTAPSAGGFSATGETTWTHPSNIFFGWIERWPMSFAGEGSEVDIVANDRLKKIGDVNLHSAVTEILQRDEYDTILSLTEDAESVKLAGGRVGVQNHGRQASFLQGGVVLLQKSKNAGAVVYTFGAQEGPTEIETAYFQSGATATDGYAFPIPYTVESQSVNLPDDGGDNETPTDTPGEHTREYPATWSRSYNGDNTPWQDFGDDTPYAYQGWVSSTHGRTKSLLGFNQQQIANDLQGATVIKCVLVVKNEHSYWNGGMTLYVGTHDYATKPGSWSDGQVQERRKHKDHGQGASVSVDLGVTIGNELKAGTHKGIAIGPPPSNSANYYGYYKGATQSSKPYLKITYTVS